MARIRPNRPGYNGWTCTGIDYDVIGPIACTGNKYKQIPPLCKGAVSNVDNDSLAFAEVARIDSDPLLQDIVDSCAIDFDPFNGTFIDLYGAFVRNGIASVIETGCYEADEVYEEGYLNPAPILPALMFSSFVTNNGGAGGGTASTGKTGAYPIAISVGYSEGTGALTYMEQTFTFTKGLLTGVSAAVEKDIATAVECPVP